MFKTATNIKLHLLIKGENDAQALLLLLFLYGVSVKKAKKDLVRGVCFPHLFIFRGEKKGKGQKLIRSCNTGKLHGERITRITSHCEESAKRLKLNNGVGEFFETFLKLFQFF